MLMGGMIVLGSGVGIYAWFSSVRDFTPEAVRRRTGEITQIEIPDYFHPVEGMSVGMFFSKKNIAIYRTEDYRGVKGELMLTGLTGKMATIAKNLEKLTPSMRLYTEIYQNIDVESTNHESIRVRGKDADFMFRKGTHRETGTLLRMVEGSFPAQDGGMTYFYLQLPDGLYKKAEVVGILQSIR